ncbi:hypothetical protein RJ640_020407 [Escallonia rubra]|uniref:Ty3 transposon capsid-like protein domain-containing protein n=1 Tax=Escallonia rubra TaxID=112253 RepID=A0AA88RRX6_9ASTE|nr:hypothetical protein RJ640_020407 [Escallonia rubra]
MMGTRLATYDVRMASVEATMRDLQRGFSDLKLELAKFMAQVNARTEAHSKTTADRGESSHRTTDRSTITIRTLHHLLQLPKLLFPRFNGDDPRGWVRKAEQYFELCPIHEDYKVPYASVHFDSQAEHWYAAYIKPVENVDWDSFVKDLYARFSVLTGVSVLGEFNKLQQIGTVDDYFNRFEALRAQVVQEFDYLDESYFCMSFIEGLRPEIQSRVEQFEVGSLTKAIHIARREEVAIQNLLRGHKSMHTAFTTSNYIQTSYKPTFTNPGPFYKTTTPTTTAKPATVPPMPLKPPALPYTNTFQRGLLPTPPRPPPKSNQLSTEEHQRRMNQGLCFRIAFVVKIVVVAVGIRSVTVVRSGMARLNHREEKRKIVAAMRFILVRPHQPTSSPRALHARETYSSLSLIQLTSGASSNRNTIFETLPRFPTVYK